MHSPYGRSWRVKLRFGPDCPRALSSRHHSPGSHLSVLHLPNRPLVLLGTPHSPTSVWEDSLHEQHGFTDLQKAFSRWQARCVLGSLKSLEVTDLLTLSHLLPPRDDKLISSPLPMFLSSIVPVCMLSALWVLGVAFAMSCGRSTGPCIPPLASPADAIFAPVLALAVSFASPRSCVPSS